MFGAISRRLLTGGALLLSVFLTADAAETDEDLPDLADQIAVMASEVALELQQICPPADLRCWSAVRARLQGPPRLLPPTFDYVR